MRVRVAPTIAAAVAAVFVVTPVAAAHVTLNPREWEAGGFARFAIRVPNERDDAATTKITLRFPEPILSASFQPIEGWRRTVTMVRLDEPTDVEGEQISEKIDTVTWSGGRIAPGEFQEFGVSIRMPEEPETELAFPAVQTYSGGEVVRWIGPPDADEPAPTVAVTEPASEEGEAPAPTATPAQDAGAVGREEDGGGSDTLSIIALLVGLAGLASGLVAIFWRGRRSETTGTRPEATAS